MVYTIEHAGKSTGQDATSKAQSECNGLLCDFWVKNDKETEDHWLVLEDKEGWYRAVVTWDGCVHFNRLHNVPLPITEEHPQLVDHIHYCDIEEEIKRLQALLIKAKEFFGEDWPA